MPRQPFGMNMGIQTGWGPLNTPYLLCVLVVDGALPQPALVRDVQLGLQLPQGWTATDVGPTSFTSVAPGTAPTATFQVTPPSYAPNASAVVHATATMDSMTREAGVTVTVS